MYQVFLFRMMGLKVQFLMIAMTLSLVHGRSKVIAPAQVHRFTKVECSSSNVTLVKGYCFVRAYSRNYASLNFGGVLLRTIRKLYVELKTFYRYGNVFKRVIRTPRVEWCSFMDGKDNNTMMNMVVDLIKDSAPSLCQKCPYKGEYKVLNLTFTADRFLSVFPSGNYKNEVWMYDDIDENISKVIFYTTVKSELIESF